MVFFFFLNLIAKNFKKKTESDWMKPNLSHSVLKKETIRTSAVVKVKQPQIRWPPVRF